MSLCDARRKHAVLAYATAATVFFGVLSGCSSEGPKREYAIPKELCGHAIKPNDIAPFLPPGRKITIREKIHTATKICELTVDKTLTVTTTRTWRTAGGSTDQFSRRSLEPLKHSEEGGRFRYSDFEAFGKTRKCIAPEGGQELYTAIQALGSKHRDAEAMRRLIISYTTEVEKSPDCVEGVS